MQKIIYLFLVMAAIFFTGCQKSTELSDSEKKAMVKAVQEKSQELYGVLQYDTGTLRKVMAYYDENNEMEWQTDPVTFVDNTFIHKNRSDLVDSWRSLIDRRISTSSTIEESHYEVLSRDKVLEVCKGDFTNVRKDGTIAGPFTMVNTVIWIDRDGEWKIQYYHQSWGRKSE
jgi:hypothetical protein